MKLKEVRVPHSRGSQNEARARAPTCFLKRFVRESCGTVTRPRGPYLSEPYVDKIRLNRGQYCFVKSVLCPFLTRYAELVGK